MKSAVEACLTALVIALWVIVVLALPAPKTRLDAGTRHHGAPGCASHDVARKAVDPNAC